MSNTANAGNPDRRQGCSPLIVLIAGALALLFAALVGPRLIGVLLALAAPPEPPLPDEIPLTLESHQNLTHGVDEWVYVAGQNVCEIVNFYERQDGQCPIVPPQCAEASASDLTMPDEDAAFCYGDVEFSVFAMRWRFRVASDDVADRSTRFHLMRVVSWTGSLPA